MPSVQLDGVETNKLVFYNKERNRINGFFLLEENCHFYVMLCPLTLNFFYVVLTFIDHCYYSIATIVLFLNYCKISIY